MATRSSTIALAALVLGAVGSARAADPPGEAVVPDAGALAQLVGFTIGLTEADQFSGVVLVARDGRVLFEKAYDKLEADKDAPTTTQSRYNLASAG